MTAMEEPGYLPFNVKAKADYVARSQNEISLIAGKIYSVTSTDQKGLWWKSIDQVKGHSAWFPAAFTVVIPNNTGGLPPPISNLPPVNNQSRPNSTNLVQPAFTQKTPNPQPTVQTQQPLPNPHQQTLPTPQPRPNSVQQPLPQPQQPLPQPQQPLPQPQLPLPTPNNNNNNPQLPSRPQPNPKPVPQLPNPNPNHSQPNLPQPNPRNSGLRPGSTNENRSQPKLEVEQFHVVPNQPQVNQDKPPSPSRDQKHAEPNTYTTLKLHLVECKDLKGLDKSGTPTAFIVHKDPYAAGTQGSVLLQTLTLKGPHPQFNEMFQIEVEDPEKTQIIVRISNGKKHTTQGKDKAYVGEVKVELRAAASIDFRTPKSLFKWWPVMNGNNKVGEAKLWLELNDLREKTYKPPSNFQRHGHIGMVDGVFSADNLPREIKEQLRLAGVTKKDMNTNPELRDKLLGLIMDEMEKGGGGDPQQSQPLPQQPYQQQQPLPSLPQQPNRPVSLPNPQQQNLPQPNHANSQPAILFNPQPSLPPQQHLPQQHVSSDEPMMRGTPPPMKDTAGHTTAQPNTNGRAPRGPARAPKTDISGGGHHITQNTEQPVQERPKPQMPSNGGGMGGDLMAEIAKGKQLRSAQEAREPELPAQTQGGLAGALAAALDANRKVLGGAVDDESEGSDWD